MNDYISREAGFEILQSRLDSISQMSYLNMDWHELDIMRNAIKDAINDNNIDLADSVLLKLKEDGFEHEKSVMYNQAVLYEKKGEWKNALNTFNYYLKQYPGDENALHEIEFISAQLNNGNN